MQQGSRGLMRGAEATRTGATLRRGLALAALLAATAASAQYKVIGPDGRVTYTDIPPANAPVRSVEQRSFAGGGPAAGSLPVELQRAIERNPVTLYTIEGKCDPCSMARSFLRNRGIPFSDRIVKSNDDIRAFRQNISPEGTIPIATVGSRKLVGFEPNAWGDALDSAGYPSESRLPRDYQAPAPQGVAAAPVTPENSPAEPAPIPTEAPPAVNGPPGFRF